MSTSGASAVAIGARWFSIVGSQLRVGALDVRPGVQHRHHYRYRSGMISRKDVWAQGRWYIRTVRPRIRRRGPDFTKLASAIVTTAFGKPQFTKRTEHVVPGGGTVKAVGGTQCMDGWWATGKRNCHGARADTEGALSCRVAEAQWRHWIGIKDRWEEAGKVLSWTPQ